MTFLLVSAVMFMLSSSVVEYSESSTGHSVFQTTLTIDTSSVVKSDTSPTKHVVPSQVSVFVDCRDFTEGNQLDVSLIDLVPNDDWYMAVNNLDDISQAALEVRVIEGAYDICQRVIDSDRYYKQQLKSERKV